MSTRLNLSYPPEVKGHPLLEKIWKQTNWANSNFIAFVNGLPGMGKSTLAQYLQYVCDRGNNYEYRAKLSNWCLTQKTFLQAVNKHIGITATGICWEEPYSSGIKDGGSNARDFQKYASKQISTVFNTMRKNNHLIILTLPASSLFDKQARSVAHCLIHVQKNNGVYGTARVYMREYNPIFDTVNHPFIRVQKKGRWVRVKNLFFGLPSDAWKKACDEKSDAYKDFWQKEIQNYKAEEKRRPGQHSNTKALFVMSYLKNPMAYQMEVKGSNRLKMNYKKIMDEFKVPWNTAKGYVAEAKSAMGEQDQAILFN